MIQVVGVARAARQFRDVDAQLVGGRSGPVGLLRSTLNVERGMTAGPSNEVFGAIAREQLPWLYSLARRLTGDDAEDVVQECLLRAFRAYGELRDVEAAPAWFRRILVNCANDLHRRKARQAPETHLEDDVDETTLFRRIADEDPLPYSDSVHLDFLQSFTEEDVWKVLDRLQPKYRVPLVLVHMEGLSSYEAARMLGVPLNTLLSWLHRGRRAFEKEMWDYADGNDLLRAKEGAHT